MRLLPRPALAALLLPLAGCSTIISTPLQTVTVTSEPRGATLVVDGVDKGPTPATVELSRWRDHEITVEARGHQPQTVHLRRGFNPWTLANISNGILVGVATDASTGAMYQLKPGAVAVDLDRK